MGNTNVQFEEKMNTKNFNVGALVCAEELRRNGIKGVCALRARPHAANPAICEKKGTKELSVSKEWQQKQVKEMFQDMKTEIEAKKT